MCPGLELGRRWGEGQELVLGGQEEDDKKDLLHTHTQKILLCLLCCLTGRMSLSKETQRNTAKMAYILYAYMLMNTYSFLHTEDKYMQIIFLMK